jgi:hypothetical protein
MKNLFRPFLFSVLFCSSGVTGWAQTFGWQPLTTGFTENLNSLISMDSSVLAVGADGRYAFYYEPTGQLLSAVIPSVSNFLSAEKIRIGSLETRTFVLAAGNKIFRVNASNNLLLSDTLPEMPRTEESASRLIDLNVAGLDQMRYGFTLDSGRILACKMPFGTSRFEFRMPSKGRINDLAAFASWGVIAVGDSGKIWRTTGLDQDFQPVSQLFHTHRINALIKCENAKFWAVGDQGSLLFSANSGASWNEMSFPVQEDIMGGVFADSSLFLFSSGGKIFRSDNEGESWTEEQLPTAGSIRDMTVSSNGTLYCVGDNGTWLKRTSGETSVQRFRTEFQPSIRILSGAIEVQNPDEKPIRFVLSDISGRVLESGLIEAGKVISLTSPISGIYLIRMRAADGRMAVRRLVPSE